MATDQHDKKTASLPLDRRGRPPIGDAPMTPAERQARRRERMQERGYRQASVFVPRCMLPGQLLEACNQWLMGKTALCERADTGWIPAQVLETDREIQEAVDDLDAEFGEDQWHDRYSIETITADMLDIEEAQK